MKDKITPWLESLPAETSMAVTALQQIVERAAPELEEDFKWNGPSYRLGEMHCVTIGRTKHDGVRLVLHRDAKVKSLEGFSFMDADGIAKWPSPDRGVVEFTDASEITAQSKALSNLIKGWVTAVK